MNAKNHPEWGLFGAATEDTPPSCEAETERPQDKYNETADSSASEDALRVEYVKEVVTNAITGDTTFRIKPEDGDTPEQLAEADAWLDHQIAKHEAKVAAAISSAARLATSNIASGERVIEKKEEADQALKSKELITLLKIIGGMAMSVYAIPIHSRRLEGIGELHSDLARVGVNIDEDTLRKWIKKASDVIEQRPL